jgi:hypothetical protein
MSFIRNAAEPRRFRRIPISWLCHFFNPGLHECAVHLLCASFWFPIHRIQLSLNSLSWAITLTMPARPVLFQNVREADTLAGAVGRLPAEASGVETFPTTVTA